jgi:hypothetical protein
MHIRAAMICWLALAVVGCGGARVAPVSGRVTLDSKALANAMIVFQPSANDKNPGPGSSAKTDQDGKFTLQLMTGDGPGAIVGKHKVSITAYEGDDTVPSSGSDIKFRKALLPDEYNASTKLTFDVPPGGAANANFDLTTPKPK